MSGEGTALAGPQVGSNPFSLRAVLALVLIGSALFVALLWMIGSGMTGGSTNDGGAHAGGKGLNGYAAFADLLERQGYFVRRLRSQTNLKDEGLLVLTPEGGANAKEITKIIEDRRRKGPTLLILPKWNVLPAKFMGQQAKDAKDGWVVPMGTSAAGWANELEGYALEPRDGGDRKQPMRWQGLGRAGSLPDPKVQFLESTQLVPLITGDDQAVLAGYWQDDGYYPDLEAAADAVDAGGEDEELFPLIVIAEPDLINNWGMADQGRAMAALRLVSLAQGGRLDPVSFDLTLNGFSRSSNMLTLAFKPPFLAATLCLLLAGLVAGWRAFRRFGPPLAVGRAIAFGKRALVANAAGLIRRSGRFHLLGTPYAAMIRERLARTLALPRHADPLATEAAIDRALTTRAPESTPFSTIAAQLRAARRPGELLRAGRALHSLERTLTR